MEGAVLVVGLALIFLIMQIGASIWTARQLPSDGPVPINFDIRGRADAFGPRWITLGLMPACYVFVNGLILVLDTLEPNPMSELVVAQVILGALLLATHVFIMFLLLRWARGA